MFLCRSVEMDTGDRYAGGSPAMDQHWDRLRLDGPLGSYADSYMDFFNFDFTVFFHG